MRRIILLLAVAAMMLALPVSPALAQTDIPPPGDQPPPDTAAEGTPRSPDTSPAQPTPRKGENCLGQDASAQKGPGNTIPSSNPGSAAKPTDFNGEPAFNGPVTSTVGTQPADTFFPESELPNVISAFQEFKRDTLGPASCERPAPA
jgi:hypothetical protein